MQVGIFIAICTRNALPLWHREENTLYMLYATLYFDHSQIITVIRHVHQTPLLTIQRFGNKTTVINYMPSN